MNVAASDPESPGRRRALTVVTALFGAISALVMALPITGYLLSPILRRKRDEWIELGAVDSYPLGQTRLVTYRNPHRTAWDGATQEVAAYVRRKSGEQFEVFAVNCTHLGCPVDWFPESGLFMCPCHGGVYYEDGGHASGPPPRGLYRYETRVEKGRLFVMGGHLPTLQDPI